MELKILLGGHQILHIKLGTQNISGNAGCKWLYCVLKQNIPMW